MTKLLRITTVPMSLKYLMPGQLKFMQQHGFDVVMISADGIELAEAIENEKCRHVIVPMTRKITPWQDLKCIFKLIKIFKKEKPDIVHSMTPKAGLLGMIAAKYCGIPIRIHDVVGMPLMVQKGIKYQVLKNVEKITYAAANHVWPNSYSLLNFINKKKLTSNHKLKVIAEGSSNGVDMNRYNIQNLDTDILEQIKLKINYSNDNIYLLCVGRLVTDKGIMELVNVFKKIQQQRPGLRLILVGKYEADLDPLPQEILLEIQQNPAIIHIDWSSQVEYYMHIADLFVFPSYREGLPTVLLEAAAMQLPIVCSRIAGNVDIVTHKKTGLIFDSKNEFQLEEQITFALDNKSKMKEMAGELLQFIQTHFTRENIWNCILKEYEYLLKK
ncbi:MAG: glycosyltransferase family 4 protein [Chitinophagaceae bacterium]|nr:glycosyltransferase family 4 protein [Chitinophagaceae bacterium]